MGLPSRHRRLGLVHSPAGTSVSGERRWRISSGDIRRSRLYAPSMSDLTEPEAAPRKRQFPTMGGIYAGILVLVMGIIAHFSKPQPFWAAINAVVIVLSIGFVIANLVGLFVLRKRQQS